MTTPDRFDIQGLLASGYNKLPFAAFLVLRFDQTDAARSWLAGLIPQVTNAVKPSHGFAHGHHRHLNVAFTCHGLQGLGLREKEIGGFSIEFRLGMIERKQILGDVGLSAPGQWEAGFAREAGVHGLLMLYAQSQNDLAQFIVAQRSACAAAAIAEVACLMTVVRPDQTEHFGFRDGLSQPAIRGLDDDRDPDLLATGEFILGYPNEQGELPASPTVSTATDAQDVLPRSRQLGDTDEKDLGCNGTYLVFRKLYQDVAHFQNMMKKLAETVPRAMIPASFANNPDEWLAAKVVGRFRNGYPLALWEPDQAPPSGPIPDNSFGYRETDPDGLRCPYGAHVRRTNPRDALPSAPDDSQHIVNQHRILRRGRSFGPPYIPDLAGSRDEQRGLYFIALCTNICRQYEFIQQTWVNNPKFAGLYDNVDCLVGPNPDPRAWGPPPSPPIPVDEDTNVMSIPAAPARIRVEGFERFVRVQGGAYFFMPSIRALRYLSQLV